MKSWKEDNLINFKENTSKNYTVYLSNGYVRVSKNLGDGDYRETNKKFITKSEASLIDKTIRKDETVTKNGGLAPYVDGEYKDIIDSITYGGIKEGEIRGTSTGYTFKPIIYFNIQCSNVGDDTSLKNYLMDFVEGQCSDGWGEGFEQRALPVKPRKDRFGFDIPVKQYKYYSPWSQESEVWIREK